MREGEGEKREDGGGRREEVSSDCWIGRRNNDDLKNDEEDLREGSDFG